MISSQALKTMIGQQGFLVLDGGLATELERHDFDLNHPLWSARLLNSYPSAIQDVHASYLNAGADVIISASYQASLPGFAEQGIPESTATQLLKKSVQLARTARDEYWAKANPRRKFKPLVAASIGPYGAYLANGAEYHGNYGISKNALSDFHQPRWEILEDAEPDFFACETIPSFQEAVVLRKILETNPTTTAWVSFSCRDEMHIADGTPIRQCADFLKECEQIVAIGINCTSPAFIPSLIAEIAAASPEKPIVIYPNSGEKYDAVSHCWTDTASATDFSVAAQKWHQLGARLIGGCCRTTPDHIRQIRAALSNAHLF